MREGDIRETMEQIHISEEMQERIIVNVWKRMEHGNHGAVKHGSRGVVKHNTEKRNLGKAVTDSWGAGNIEKAADGGRKAGNWRRKARAAALLLAAGILSIPVQAVVTSLVRERMESIPEEELWEMGESIQEQEAEADSFSREYTDREMARMRELLQSYQDGTFPERTILQVDHEDEAPEGTLCYVRGRSYFCLPERELTDEELLEIIDFNRTRNYALSQRPAAQENLKEYQEERQRRREQIRAAGGISEEEAVEIAEGLMKEALGEAAVENAEIHISYIDISNADYEHKGDIAYMMIFSNLKEGPVYTCTIDSQDGSILEAKECRN